MQMSLLVRIPDLCTTAGEILLLFDKIQFYFCSKHGLCIDVHGPLVSVLTAELAEKLPWYLCEGYNALLPVVNILFGECPCVYLSVGLLPNLIPHHFAENSPIKR